MTPTGWAAAADAVFRPSFIAEWEAGIQAAASRAQRDGLSRAEFFEVLAFCRDRYTNCRIATTAALLNELDDRVRLRADGDHWDVPELWMLDALTPREVTE